MTIKQIITQLTESGHNITFRIRSDGGIIVKSINGRKTGITEGNRIVREMIGEEGALSEARRVQTSFNVEKKIKKESLSKSIKSTIRKVQTQIKKQGNKGTIKTKQVRYHIKKDGEEEAMRYLKGRERYFKGYAYKVNVEALADRLERLALETDKAEEKAEVQELVSKIRSMSEEFKEADIEPIYQIAYKKKSVKQRIQEIKNRLHLA